MQKETKYLEQLINLNKSYGNLLKYDEKLSKGLIEPIKELSQKTLSEQLAQPDVDIILNSIIENKLYFIIDKKYLDKFVEINAINILNYFNKNSHYSNIDVYLKDEKNKFFSIFYKELFSNINDIYKYENIVYNIFKYNNINSIDYFIANYEKQLKSFKANYNNISYATNDFIILDKLKNIDIQPKNLDDWVQKNIYKYIDNIKSKNYTYLINQRKNEQFLINDNIYSINGLKQFLTKCKEKNLNLEFFNSKKINEGKLISPPLWILIQRDLNLYDELKQFLDPTAVDSGGNNFIQYLLNITKKTAPDTKDSESYELIKKIIFDNKFDLEHKNHDGFTSIDMLKRIIKKETKKDSLKLSNYKSFCEKILLELNFNLQPIIKEQSIKKHKL